MRKILSKTFLIILTLSLSLLAGCAGGLKLTHFQTGQVLHGEYSQISRGITVTMPDGEVLKGQYSAVQDAASNITTGYALLTSETSGLMMEIIIKYGGHIFGIAKTNDGRTYRVQDTGYKGLRFKILN